jgi:hypothetical protein
MISEKQTSYTHVICISWSSVTSLGSIKAMVTPELYKKLQDLESC